MECVFGMRLREVIRLHGVTRLRGMCLRNASSGGDSSSRGNSSSWNQDGATRLIYKSGCGYKSARFGTEKHDANRQVYACKHAYFSRTTAWIVTHCQCYRSKN